MGIFANREKSISPSTFLSKTYPVAFVEAFHPKSIVVLEELLILNRPGAEGAHRTVVVATVLDVAETPTTL